MPTSRTSSLPTFSIVDGTLVQTSPGAGLQGLGHVQQRLHPGRGRASRIGVKGSEDLGNGLKAIYQVEFGINLNDTNNNVLSNADSITYRNTFVGLAGDWGTSWAVATTPR
jgi:predicted porin